MLDYEPFAQGETRRVKRRMHKVIWPAVPEAAPPFIYEVELDVTELREALFEIGEELELSIQAQTYRKSCG